MRILIVTSQFPLAGDPGRGRPILQTVRELSRLADVHVVSPVARYPRWARPRSYLYREARPAPAGDSDPVEYRTYPALPALSRPFNGWLCGRTLDAPIAAFAPDVVLSYWLYPDAFGAMQAATRAGLPLVVGARGSDLRVRDRISRALTRPVLRRARRILVVSRDLGRVAVDDYGADATRIRTIPNGCDASIFHPRDRAAARSALALAGDTPLVLYVGRLVPEKGLRELLQAMSTLPASGSLPLLVLVGDGPMRAELQALASDMPGVDVRFAGAQPAGQVALWMGAADVVTLPSYSEGHPNVLVEALACGRPVVATTVGGIPEVVDAESGILVPARDVAALASGLQDVLARAWDADLLSHRYARDWGQVARDTLSACADALSEGPVG